MATGYYNRIVQVNAFAQYAPQPDNLQQTAAIVSQGDTSVATGSTVFVSDPTVLDGLLLPGISITAMSWATGVATITLDVGENPLTPGDKFTIIVRGCYPVLYNGSYVCTVTTSTQVTYSQPVNPGSGTPVYGNALIGTAAWLVAADATWWAQNAQTMGYFLFESGSSAPSDVFSAVSTYINANPRTIYNWCFLPGLDSDPTAAIAFFNSYNTLTSLVKFYYPVTVDTYPDYIRRTFINVFAMVQTPDYINGAELDSVAYAAFITNINPTPNNKLPPSSYTYLYGVTPYPLNNTIMNAFAASNVNFVSTGAEGGISNTLLVPGCNLDGSPQNVAYSIDWQQIQLNLALANAVINGSNSQLNPLYYNQAGIDRLQAVAGATAARGIATGLALGRVILVQMDPVEFSGRLATGEWRGNYVINAVPFAIYAAQNPSDYAQGLYNGFQASFVPQYGFKRIIFNLEATQFA